MPSTDSALTVKRFYKEKNQFLEISMKIEISSLLLA